VPCGWVHTHATTSRPTLAPLAPPPQSSNPLPTPKQAVQKERAAFSQRVVRHTPVEWVGCANEVVLMGDFDGWTKGQELSAEDVTSDSVFTRFEGRVTLRPGRYRVKLLVGGRMDARALGWMGLRCGGCCHKRCAYVHGPEPAGLHSAAHAVGIASAPIRLPPQPKRADAPTAHQSNRPGGRPVAPGGRLAF
jgi:hypothetical protein